MGWRTTLAKPLADEAEVFGGEVVRALGPTEAGIETEYVPDDPCEDWDARRVVTRALASLRPREERVLRQRFGFGCEELSREAIAEQFSDSVGYPVSSERIRQIEAKALRKLGLARRSQPLRALVEA